MYDMHDVASVVINHLVETVLNGGLTSEYSSSLSIVKSPLIITIQHLSTLNTPSTTNHG
jgi:hypothetical protein